MIPKSFQKQLSNQHQTWIDFAPNLAPFWEVLEPKMEPNSLQIASKINLQIDHLMHSVSDSSWERFWPILNPNLEPKTAQDPPSWSQDAPKSPQIAAWDSSWMLKRTLVYLKSIFHQFCIDFRAQTGLIFIDFWLIFWLIFHEFWSSLWLTFHRLWKDSGTHLASF